MPDVDFQIAGVRTAINGLTPVMLFDLQIASHPADVPVQSILLQSQIRIESTRRRYSEASRKRFVELFGPSDDWGRTLRDMLWTNQSVTVPAFTGSTTVELTVPCTFDLTVATAKYFYGIDDGEIPLLFLFTGTMFYTDAGRILIQRISWESECRYEMPIEQWTTLMDDHYPNSAWMYLDREVFDRLYAYKQRNGLTSWDAALSRLLDGLEENEVTA